MSVSASASLKLDTILDLILRQFSRRLAPITAFSYVFDAKEVARDTKVQVPFVSLENSASKDFSYDTGYEGGDFNIDRNEVAISHRKYQALSFTSAELIGLPLNVLAEGMVQKADKLAADVVNHILSVITAADYGAPIHEGEASAFYTDDIADIDTACTNALWPSVGRSLILDTSFTGNLKKDDSLKDASKSGSTSTLRDSTIGRVHTFDVDEVPGFPDNGERLKGIAALRYGILVASAPVQPAPEVLSQLSDYRVVTHPETGLTLSYRAWGNPDKDSGKRIVEFGYGFAKGDTAQIKRIALPEPEAP